MRLGGEADRDRDRDRNCVSMFVFIDRNGEESLDE